MKSYEIDCAGRQFEVYCFPYEMAGSNMFFIPSGDTGVVFDPNENEDLLAAFERHGTHRVTIVLTHEHYDHTSGVAWLQSMIEARLFCHQACADRIATLEGNDPKTIGFILSIRDAADGGHRRDDFLATAKRYVLRADETFEVACDLVVGGITLHCIPAPGHSPGSALYVLGTRSVFTGDSLIQNTPVILRLKDSNKAHYREITRPLLRSFDKSMMVFPGHGDPFSLGDALFL